VPTLHQLDRRAERGVKQNLYKLLGVARDADADTIRKAYRKLVFRKNILTGAVLINAIEQGGIFMGLIQNEIPLNVPNSVLSQPSFNFKQLMI